MIEHIESIVLNKAKKEAEEIISGALLGASEIIEKAKEKIPIIIDEYLKRAKNYIHSQRQKIIGSVQLEIKDWFIAVESGEEYELLLSIPREEEEKINKLNLPITIIGEVIEDKPGIYIIDDDLKIDISKRGYDAFAI